MEQVPQHIIYLLSKSKLEGLREDEKLQLDAWRSETEANKGLCDLIDNKNQMQADLDGISRYDWETSFTLFEQDYLNTSYPKSFYKRMWSYGIAAVLIGLLVLFFIHNLSDTVYQETPDKDIQPAQMTGVVRLGDGNSISMVPGDTLLSFASPGKNKAPRANNLFAATPKGGKMTMLLPDGTKVWMNAKTQLDYYEVDSMREVRLVGEAYFEVAKKYLPWEGEVPKLKPFVVKAGKINISVLGTHFYVKSTKNIEDFRTTLYEGKVRVRQGERQIILLPGEESYIKLGQIERRIIDLDARNALKEGYFVFNSETLRIIMDELASWYNVDVVYLDNQIKSEKFEAMLSRNSSLKDIINVLESTGKIKFKFKGKTIYVEKTT
ncbi:FecR family protein [Sphingobacterium multivorum]|uniref:FecR family protein n=1 Tax=Sphingobacterium multivorum TaxID=28454 RepID=UPI0031BA7BE0